VHPRASRRASARALPNRFDRDEPNSTVNRRSIETTLTEAWPDRRATRKTAWTPAREPQRSVRRPG